MLSDPSDVAIDAMRRIAGDVVLLGAGGKMGPSLARMVRRASDQAGVARRVIAVSRFSQGGIVESLHDAGVETIAGDLLDEKFVEQLPDAPNVIFMTGMKFGAGGNASLTWAMNTWLPTLVCRRYRGSRIAAFSTGNVYPFVPIDSGGCVEADVLNPVGEYGMSALGRERMFEYFSRRDGIPTSIVRLNYAVELRYGVLVDIARQVLEEQPVDVSIGYANVIWQGDANSMTIAALAEANSPPFVINVTGPELVSVRETALRFGELFGKTPLLVGQEAALALLNNASESHRRFGLPRVPLEQVIESTASWLSGGGEVLNKPTHFQVRDGKF